MVCVWLMRFDCFYGLLGNNVFRTFSNIWDGVFLVKIVTSNEITSLLRRWKGFWTPLLNVKSTAWSGFAYILCLKSHVYFAISVQLDFHSKSWASKAFSDRSLRSCIYTVTFPEMNILRTLKRLAAAIKRFLGKQKFVKFRKSLYR